MNSWAVEIVLPTNSSTDFLHYFTQEFIHMTESGEISQRNKICSGMNASAMEHCISFTCFGKELVRVLQKNIVWLALFSSKSVKVLCLE